MLKRKVTVTNFIRRAEILKSLAIVSFDNPGGPDGDKTDEFSEDMLPEELKASFKKYKQDLIDKGVNIGVAREKEKYSRNKGQEVDEYLTSQGLSKEDIEGLKSLAGKSASLSKLYEAYGTEDMDAIIQMIEADESKSLTEEELSKAAMTKLESENSNLKAQITALQESISSKDATIADKEAKLTAFIEKTVINSAIKQAAIDAGAYDADDVLERIKPQIKLEIVDNDYVPVVVDDKGVKRYDSNGDPVTVPALVSEFLDKRPHLRKSTLQPGAGGKPTGKETTSGGKFTKEQLKDPVFFQKHYNEIMAEVRAGNLKL